MRGRLRAMARAAAACAVAVMACSARPLPPGVAPSGHDAGAGVDADAHAEEEAGGAEHPPEINVPPSVVDWGIPIGSQPSPSTPGITEVKAVVATDDGGAIVAGSFDGTVAFAPDTIRAGTPGKGSA